MSKDWDDEFDATETPPIVYEFPYSALEKQSNETAATDNSAQVLPGSKNVSSKKSRKVLKDAEVKDGNILKSKRTYSKRKKNPLLLSSDVPQEHGKGRKERDPLETPETKNSVGQQRKTLPGKNIVEENLIPSKSNDSAVRKTQVKVSYSCKTEYTDGTSEYSLFEDIDQIPSADQSENTTKVGEQDLSLKQPLRTVYQRTRKNLRKQVDDKILDSAQSIRDAENCTKNSASLLGPNVSDSSLDLQPPSVKGNTQKGNLVFSSSLDEIIGGNVFFNIGTQPPKNQLSLMDMVKKYSEIQSSMVQSKETGKKRKAAAKKEPKVQKKAQTSKAVSGKLNHNKSESWNKSEEVSPSNMVKGSPCNSQDSSNDEFSVKHYNHNATPCHQLPQKISSDSNQFAVVKSRKSVKKEKTPAQKKQRRTRKPKNDKCLETKSHLKVTDSKVDLLPNKQVQSCLPNSSTCSNHNELQSNRNSIINSYACLTEEVRKTALITETKLPTQSTERPVFTGEECDPRPSSGLEGSDFISVISNKMNSLVKRCAEESLEEIEDWITATPSSRELTVEDFFRKRDVWKCISPLIVDCLNSNKIPDNFKTYSYEFPEDFQTVPIVRMLKDYVDQVLLQMKSSIKSFTSESIIEFAYQNMPYRECCLMTKFFGDEPGQLHLANVVAKLNFVALFVIFGEYQERLLKR